MKTQHLIVVKIHHPTNEEDFMLRIVRRPLLAEAAVKILKKIRDGQFNPKEWKKNMEELNLTYNEYYGLLSNLKAVGLIRKDGNTYKPSAQFALRLLRYIEYAEALTGIKVAKE